MRKIKEKGIAHTRKNVKQAYENYSKGKEKRFTIQDFEKNLEDNLNQVLDDLITESWFPSPYAKKVIFEKKRRVLAKAPVYDHVIEAAAILPYEKQLYDYIAWQSPAVRPHLGTHALFRFIKNDLYKSSQSDCYYNLSIDAHHYFPTMDHEIEKHSLSQKIAEGPLLRLLFKIIDSYPCGSPMGIKVSQITGQIFLASFDRLALRCFDILRDPDKLSYWTCRYISDKIATATTRDLQLLCRGPSYMANLFKSYLTEGLKHYYRFVDNIIIMHQDKTFLHIMKELCVMILARDYHVVVNKDYNIRPTWMGIRLCGYQFFHDHVLSAKNNKKKLAKKVAKLKKKGLTQEEIRLACSSTIGFVKHAKFVNLFKKIGMEQTLGKIIKHKRVVPPFEGMSDEDRLTFSKICKMVNEVTDFGGWDKKILLLDYKIVDSKIDKSVNNIIVTNSQGQQQEVRKEVPNKVLVIRYKIITNTETITDATGEEQTVYEFQKRKNKSNQPTSEDWEHYSFTGSKILIDQATKDFSKEDLPAPTVIQQFTGKNNTHFFKFT